jgi:vacuolar-type H+-ATPase subunit F/Vma7
MSHRLAVVGDATVTLGFRLAGIRPHVTESKESAAAILAQMSREPEWGVILVQEDFMPAAGPTATRRSDGGLPILVPFPAPSRVRPPGEAEAYVAELLRQAVGYRVRLR